MNTDLLKRKLMEVKSKYSQGVNSDYKEATTGSGTDDSSFVHAKSVTREANKVPLSTGPAGKGVGPKSFTGVAVSELLFVEVFAGTARLSKHAREAGFRVLPVDKTAARSSQIYIAQYDITDP